MANKQSSADSGPEKGSSLKDQIIEQIRQQEERDRRSDERPDADAAAAAGARRKSRGSAFRPSLLGPNLRQMANYCRQLATLIDVGIPLLRSLQILATRSANPALRRVSADLARRVEEGQPLSTAMMANQQIFSPMFVGVVRTGEAGGILEESMRRLADILERRADIRRRVIGAMIYPLLAVLTEIIVVCIIVIFAIPKLLSVYPKPEMLPRPTQWLYSSSLWMQSHWLLILLVLAVLIVGIFLLMRSRAGYTAFERVWLRVPLFGSVSRKVNVARFARTLGSLTAAGIPLIDGLRIAAETADSEVVESTLRRVHETVERGGKMEDPLRTEPIFDPMVVDMIMVGDEAGTLDAMLLKIADNYDAEVDVQLRAMTSILEPLLIILLGLGVAFLALAVFLPYIELVKNPRIIQM